jgi:hypothetical protein
MKIVFCSEPFAPAKVDSVYEAEAQAASRAGFEIELINFETLVDDRNAESAIRRVAKADSSQLAIYRGWMLKPEDYARLYQALLSRQLRLINTPEQYRHCHYLPESYDIIKDHTPKTVWIPYDENFSFDKLMGLLTQFSNYPIIMKDYVKSRKHEWADACYIPCASARPEVERVVGNFLELQGDGLNEGLVFREFIDFKPLTQHPKSGMPLSKEFRLFFVDGQLLSIFQYWQEGAYDDTLPPLGRFTDLDHKVRSRFFTMDIAERTNGDWMIVELGDAQVAGLPDEQVAIPFYESLAQAASPFSMG